MSRKIIAILAAASFMLAGCGRNMAGDTYTAGSASGKVLEGKIVSMRPVTIKDHDKLQDNTAGGLAGAAAGGVGGASIGHGNGSIAAAIGGAVIGAVAGAYAQDALSTSEGMEYVVKLDKQYVGNDSGSKHNKSVKESTKGSVSDDVNTSIDSNAHTDMLSVVQAADPALKAGSKVYIIYSNDRPRLAPVTADSK